MKAIIGLGGAILCCIAYFYIEHRLIFSRKMTDSERGKRLHTISIALLFGIAVFLLFFFGTLLEFF